MSWARSMTISRIEEKYSTDSQVEQTGVLSRTHQLLERKRRARINRCLEELKRLIRELTYMVEYKMLRLWPGRYRVPEFPGLNKSRSASAASHGAIMERLPAMFPGSIQSLQPHDSLLSNTFQKANEQIMPSKPRLWRPS